MPMNVVIQEKRKALGLTQEQVAEYLNVSIDERILSWYHRLSESNDIKISNSANYMIVSRLIRKGSYDQAQEALDRMPDRENIISSMADKLMLQVIIYQNQGKADKASRDLQNALLLALNKVQILLCKMVDAELAAGEAEIAEKIADKASQMPELFDLWKYCSFVAPLQIAVAEQNADKCICILRKALAALLIPWDMSSSPLFHRIAKAAKASDMKQMLSAILYEMERETAEYSFLQNRDEFKELIAKYKKLIEK